MLTCVGRRLRTWLSAHPSHTNVYGTARTLIALGTIATLVCTDTFDIFRPAVGAITYPYCRGIGHGSLFCIAGREHLHLAHLIAVLALSVVATGWRPRYTGILHWYVSWSLFISGILVDGGDQITAVLTLLLIPLTITDPRRTHWMPTTTSMGTGVLSMEVAASRLIAHSALVVIRVQMAGIYFHAAVAKMMVPEWRDGTAVYYWFTDPWFGFAEPLKSWALPLLAHGAIVASLTWGTIMLEIFLFAALIAAPTYRRVLLYLGLGFHAAIAVIHGLLSFAFPMWGGLLLYLHPIEKDLSFARVGRAFASMSRTIRTLTQRAPDAIPIKPNPRY